MSSQTLEPFVKLRTGQAQGRPFKVLGIQQIAIGGTDKTRLQKLWVDMLGLELTGTFRSERENVDEDICALGSGPFKVEVDLMSSYKRSGVLAGCGHAELQFLVSRHRLSPCQLVSLGCCYG